MERPVVIISGKNGQLAKELQHVSSQFQNFKFIFLDKQELDIADQTSIKNTFEKYSPSYFINGAAYTAVDKAEAEQEIAYKINAEAVGNIARNAYEFKTKLLHISTDYVFDGKGGGPI